MPGRLRGYERMNKEFFRDRKVNIALFVMHRGILEREEWFRNLYVEKKTEK